MKKLYLAITVLLVVLCVHTVPKNIKTGETKVALPFQNVIQGAQQGFSDFYNSPQAGTNPQGQAASGILGGVLGSLQGLNSYTQGGAVEGAMTTEAQQAAQAAAAQQAAVKGSVFGEKDAYMGSVNEGLGQYATRYGNSITDYLDQARVGQDRLNTMGAKNELARSQGVTGIQGMVGRGIQSAGVMLGNKNAGDSSAAGAIANAYGQLGQRQMANVGNQYEMGNMDIQQQQNEFSTGLNKSKRDMELGKQEKITQIINDVQSTLAGLNNQLANASLPDRIAIEQEKQAIKDRATQMLQGYDQQLNSATFNPASRQQNMAQANQLRDAGTQLGEGMFNFTEEAPLTAQGSAPAGGNLPLYTLPRRRV